MCCEDKESEWVDNRRDRMAKVRYLMGRRLKRTARFMAQKMIPIIYSVEDKQS